MIERQPKKSAATRRRHQIYVQRKLSVADGEGGFADGWMNTTSSPIWAEVSPIQARQVMDYKSVGVDATHLVRIDGLNEASEHNRITFGSRIFEILTVENIQERNVEKVIACKEVR
jgi:head-tail adaptor